MVAYQPPRSVVLMIGASFRARSLISAAQRIARLVDRDAVELGTVGITSTRDKLESDASELERVMADPLAQKHDLPLGFGEMQELLAKIRRWMLEIRARAFVNLGHDRSALERIVSFVPEVAPGYPRDVLFELERMIRAAKDLTPRLLDVGVDEKLVGKGRTLFQQLKTAIGAKDLDAESFEFKTRQLYFKKAALFMELKRIAAAGRAAFFTDPERAAEYHLDELESIRS